MVSPAAPDPYMTLLQVPNMPLWNFPSYVSRSAVCFGTLSVGETDQQILAFTNVSTKDLKIISISVAGANAADYSQTNNCGTTVSPSAQCQIVVTFQPTANGSRSAMLTIAGAGVSTLRLVVSMSGTGS